MGIDDLFYEQYLWELSLQITSNTFVISHLFIYQVSLIPKFVLIGMVCSSSKKILHFVIFLDRTFPETQINI